MTPVRTCIGCRKKDEPSGLLRMTVSADEGAERIVVPDPGHRAPGRGAHLHPTTECLDLAERRKAFPRAFRVPGPLSLRLVREYVNSENASFHPGRARGQESGSSTHDNSMSVER